MEEEAVSTVQPECSICLQAYDDSLIVPRVLSCGHSLCDCCISSLAHGDEGSRRLSFLRCPECNQRSKLQALPKNIELLRFIRGPDSASTRSCQRACSIRPPRYSGRRPSFVYEASIAELCDWIIPQHSVEITHPPLGQVFLFRGDDVESISPATFLCVQGAWKESKAGLGLDYRQKTRTSLERLSGHEIKDLLHLLKAQEEVFGIWMDAEDGCLYLVYKTLSECQQLSGALLETGTSTLSHLCRKRGIELCEIFMGLHREHVVAGMVTPTCLGDTDFMHLRLNVGALLSSRNSFPVSVRLNEPAALKPIPMNEVSQSVGTFPFFYCCPELLLLLQNLDTSQKFQISCKVDSWTLACLFCKYFIGGTPWDGFTLEQFLEMSVSGMQHAKSWINHHIDLDTLDDGTSAAEVVRNILRCFSHSPEDRPCISEIWHLLTCIQTSSCSDKGSGICCNAGVGASATLWCLTPGCNIYAPRKDDMSAKQDSLVRCIESVSLDSSENCLKGRVQELQKSGTLEGHLGDVTCLAVFGQYLLSASLDKSICVWSLEDSMLIKSLRGHSQKVMALVCDQQSTIFVSGDYGGELFAWDVESSGTSFVNKWHHHRDWRFSGVASLAISSDSFLYSGAGDKTIKVWSLQDFGLLGTLEGHKAMVSALLVDGEILFSGSWDGTVRLWWRSDYSPLAVLNESMELGVVLALSSSAELLLVGYQSGRIQVWKDEVCINTVSAHDNAISSLCLSGDTLYSGSWDGRIKAWNVNNLLDNTVPTSLVTCDSAVKALGCSDERLFVGVTSKAIIMYIIK